MGFPATFPDAALPDVEGRLARLDEAWAQGPALVILGHRNCKTTRQTLPYVDRIHRRGGRVLAVLQDDAVAARELVGELGLALPVRLEEDPYPVAAALGVETVPTLMLVEKTGAIAAVSEGFGRDALEMFAGKLGLEAPLFAPEDKAPASKPG
jgi:hypothetical protein